MVGPVMLVDGNNLLVRCIKAMEYSGLRNGESWETGPLTAFIGALGRLTRAHEPSAVVVCWDAGPSVRRKALYDGYKAARAEHPSPQYEERKETAFGMAKAFLKACRIQQVAVSGYEADDVVAAYWAQVPMNGGPCREVRTADGTPFWVSPEDYERVIERRWSISGGYPRHGTTANGAYLGIHLHRFLMDLPKDDPREVDHRNGDGLDNRRANLRIVTHAENHQNRSETKGWGYSGHRGVSWSTRKQKWIAYGYLNGKQQHVGYFAEEEEAAEAARRWRSENMPLSDRDEAPQSPRSQQIVIVSGDKDFLQMVGPNPAGVNTIQLRPDNAGTYKVWGREEVQEEYGCPPECLPLLMALMGDPIDGIPGVRGLGPKKALKGLEEAGWSLQSVAALKDPEKLCDAILSHALVDLRDPEYHPQVPPLKPFAPLDPSEGGACLELVNFLRALDLETVLNRFYTGTLWK